MKDCVDFVRESYWLVVAYMVSPSLCFEHKRKPKVLTRIDVGALDRSFFALLENYDFRLVIAPIIEMVAFFRLFSKRTGADVLSGSTS